MCSTMIHTLITKKFMRVCFLIVHLNRTVKSCNSLRKQYIQHKIYKLQVLHMNHSLKFLTNTSKMCGLSSEYSFK